MKLIRKRVLLKVFAVFFLLEIITGTVAPAVSWALTSGPTVPEATSFEPIDTTDMVNLNTGDFNYTMPLLEVPGPGGGYPLSLSYHAGILPNEDASWVGLGWTLNPGAIVRNVNGFADDHRSVTEVTRQYWVGGEMRTYSVGLTLGAAGTPMSMTVGASISHDTYQGRGIGMNWSFGGGYGLQIGGSKSPFNVGAGFSIGSSYDGYGNYSDNVSAGLSLGWQGKDSNLGISVGVGVGTNFKSVGVGYSASLSLNRSPSNGSTMSSGEQGSASVGVSTGLTYSSNSRAGVVSTNQHGWSVPIPVWYGVSITLGYRYQRYWIDQTEATRINGALNYFGHNTSSRVRSTTFDDINFDTYSLVDLTAGGIVDNPDPGKTMGGSFPNYDDYQVHAQGIFGAMRPYYYQRHIYQRNNFTNNGGKNYTTADFDLVYGIDTSKYEFPAAFRFVNDFANRFEYNAPALDDADMAADGHMQYKFSNVGVSSGEDGTATYTSNNIQGSRSITTFTNNEINSGAARSKGFVEARASGFIRASPPKGADVGEQIGGFTIVNESGVKYHFSLPAYSYQEYAYSGNIEGEENYNEFYKKHPYAYTWFLTAITGPDYVDRSSSNGPGDGTLNEYDWGYWVEFEYGKWTSDYTWRNPSEGMDPDLDEQFQNFSEGKKEIYYLDAIRTKTHTALFVKDIRHDGKGAVYSLRSMNDRVDGDGLRGKDIISGTTKSGGFIPIKDTVFCDRRNHDSSNQLDQEGTVEYVSRPTSVMKLSRILLMNNNDMPAPHALDKSGGEAYRQRYTYSWNVTKNNQLCAPCQKCDFSTVIFDHHLHGNVFDVYDAASANFASKAIRIIQFDTDQSLCPGTANSFDYTLVNTADPSTSSGSYSRMGKLTLKAVQFLGKAGVSFMPPTKFSYDVDYTGTVDLKYDIGRLAYYFNLSGSKFKVGDVVRMARADQPEKVRYWQISRISNNKHELRRIYGDPAPATVAHTFQLTKNPPYEKGAYDIWGCYKVDHKGGNDNLSRLTSEESAAQVDAWSLRGITAATGAQIKIEYESDTYTTPELYTRNMLSMTDMQLIPESKNVRFTFVGTEIDLGEISSQILNSRVEMLVAKDIYVAPGINNFGCFGEPFDGGDLMGSLYLLKPVVITAANLVSISSNVIEIHAPTYFDDLYNVRRIEYDNTLYNGLSCVAAYNNAYNPPVDIKSASLVAGNLCLPGNLPAYGGGIRTREISVTDLDGSVSSTNYTYENGRTSYEPLTFGRVVFKYGNYGNGQPRINNAWAPEVYRREKGKKDYQRVAYGNFSRLLSNAIEVPAPGVLYGKVTVRNKVSDGIESKTLPVRQEYEFQTFTDDLVDIQYTQDKTSSYTIQKVYQNFSYDEVNTRKVTLRDYSSRVGNLKRVVTYNAANEKLTETVNHYLYDGIVEELQQNGYTGPDVRQEANRGVYGQRLDSQFGSQGVIEETFTDAHLLRKTGSNMFKLQATVTTRESYPSVQTGSTTINHKTGVTGSSRVLAFDYYSAQPVKTLSKDGYGHAYVQETLPAYRKYAGMKQAANGGKNMLTQEAATVTYKVDPDNVESRLGVMGASIQTWSDQVKSLRPQQALSGATVQTGIWRMQTAYTFVGSERNVQQADGSYKVADFSPGFNTWISSNVLDPTVWQRGIDITLYDVYSNTLEARDLNGDFVATRMSYNQSRVMATASNASYQEMGYANVEESPAGGAFGGDVQVVGNTFSTSAHTGKRALTVAAGATAFVFPMITNVRAYRVSFWSTHPNAFVKYKYNDTGVETSVAVENKGKAGNWYLLEADFIPTASSVNVWCGAGAQQASFDDFRVCPVDAAMTSYVYNAWGELSHILGTDNLFTEYVYDGGGRLIRVNREVLGTGVIKVGETKYHYAGQ